jgi:hypothetical protein
MDNMFDVQLLMILSLLRSSIMAFFLKDVLELLMAATYTSLHLPFSKVSIGIGKAFFHSTVFSYAILTCSSHIFSQAGKAQQQMHESGLMPWQRVFQCPQGFIILQMQDFLIARNFLFHFMVFSIIFRSGVLQVFSKCFAKCIYYSTHSGSPANTKELFNLNHAQACNVIEHIFGVLKQHFQILLLPPCYPLDFQPHIPAALCALQNFIQEIDHDEGEIPTDVYQAAYELFPPDVDNDHEGGFITKDDDEGNSVAQDEYC